MVRTHYSVENLVLCFGLGVLVAVAVQLGQQRAFVVGISPWSVLGAILGSVARLPRHIFRYVHKSRVVASLNRKLFRARPTSRAHHQHELGGADCIVKDKQTRNHQTWSHHVHQLLARQPGEFFRLRRPLTNSIVSFPFSPSR